MLRMFHSSFLLHGRIIYGAWTATIINFIIGVKPDRNNSKMPGLLASNHGTFAVRIDCCGYKYTTGSERTLMGIHRSCHSLFVV